MTSKLVVNTIEADTGISSVSFASSISLSSTSVFHLGNAGLNIGADTNINRPSAGVIGFNINGSEAARITANGFSGDGSQLTGLPAGLGTALSTVQTSPLNKLYYTDRILSIGSTVTIDHPASATGAYTQYADILVEDNADLIVADGDDLIPDILGLGGNGTTGAGGAGRLLVDNIVNRSATGAPNFPNGLTGTAGTFTAGTAGVTLTQSSNTPRIEFKSNNVANTAQIVVAESSGGGVLQFYTKASGGSFAEKARIDLSGRLLVGRTNNISVGGDSSDHCFEQITSKGYTLTLHANQNNQRGLGIFYASGKTPEAFMFCEVSGSNKFIILSSGNVINANNSYGQISDISLKENIVDAKSQWNDIKNLKIRNFNFKSSTGHDTHTQIGLVAQEVETVCPKLVDTNEDGKKIVTSSVLYMKAVKALQEAQTRIETLEAKVTALEGS